jgi:hypothetical protein
LNLHATQACALLALPLFELQQPPQGWAGVRKLSQEEHSCSFIGYFVLSLFFFPLALTLA